MVDLNPYETPTHVADEPQKPRPWLLVLISAGLGIATAIVGLAKISLPSGPQPELEAVGVIVAIFLPAMLLFWAALLFAAGSQKAGDWYLCGGIASVFILPLLATVLGIL